MPKVHYFQ